MTTPTAYYFRIAGLYVKIIFLPSQRNSVSLIPSFQPFACKEVADSDLFFQIDVDDNLRPVPKDQRSLIRDFDTGNGNIIVYQLTDGGYQYVIKDINGYSCALLITNKNFVHCHCALNGNYDIEHTIPRSLSFDDSLANKTICEADFNRNKKKDLYPTQLKGVSYKDIPDVYKVIEENK